MDLVFLAHRMPFPPQKGDKIRSWHMLRYLSKQFTTHLGCFFDDESDKDHIEYLRTVCGGEVFCLPLRRQSARLRSLRSLGFNQPLTINYFHDKRMQAWVKRKISADHVGAIFISCSAMAAYVIGHQLSGRKIIDLVDVDSEKWRQYASSKKWPMTTLLNRESRTLLNFERKIVSEFDCALFSSDAEALLFKKLAPEFSRHIRSIRNGVDTNYFTPQGMYVNPYREVPGESIVFIGVMDYWPNVQAVSWFVDEVMPLLRQHTKGTTFWIVGSNPVSSVQRLSGCPDVRVTGRVPDVRPYLAHAHAVVAPLKIGRGIQNKVLEAMAMAKYVVVTPQAAEGIEVQNGRELMIANTPAEFFQSILQAFQLKPEGLAHRARLHVLRNHQWDVLLRSLDDLFR